MSLTTINLTGTILPPDSVSVGGTVTFELSSVVIDAGSGVVVPRVISTPILAGGDIDVDIWPNALGSFPTYYTVAALLPGEDCGCGPRKIILGTLQLPATPSEQDITEYLASYASPVPPAQFWMSITQGEYDAAIQAALDAALAADQAETAQGLAEAARTAAETAASNAQSSSRTVATWTILAALTGSVAGEGAEVLDSDTGTHTDPVVGGTVDNAGRYSWSESPAGWERIGGTGLSAKADVADLAALSPIGNPGRVFTGESAVADGLAATVLSEHFDVLAGNEIIRYRHDAGPVAAERARFATPSTFSFFEFPDSEFSDVAFAVVDDNDRVSQVTLKSGETIITSQAADTDDRAEPTIRHARVRETVVADILHILGLGQSNMVRAARFGTPNADDLGLSAGIQIETTDTGNTFVALSTLTNANDVPSGVAFNAIQQMRFLLVGNSEYTPDPDFAGEFVSALTTHGVNGRTIAQLSKGGSSTGYADSQHGVSEVKRLSNADGEISYVPAWIWLQGEGDADVGTTGVDYLSAFQALVSDYRADIRALTGQQTGPVVFTYQLSSEGNYDANTGQPSPSIISQALFEATQTDPDVLIFSPTYWVTHADPVHLDGQQPMGAPEFGMMLGKVMYKVICRGEDWHPVEPLRIIQHSARVITVKFHVPELPLTFDTTAVTNPGDYGFRVEDVGGFVSIASVTIIRDTVRIVTAADIGASAKVSYAYYGTGGQGGGPVTGARGNLRDSDPTVSYTGVALPNWAVQFIEPVGYQKGA